MKFFRHEYILLAAFLAFAAVYLSLRGQSFSIDAALSATFTVVVFAHAIRKRGRRLIRGEEARSLPEILFAHVVCVTTLVLILRIGMFVSILPAWLTLPVAADNYGSLGPSVFQLLQALAVSSLGYCEWRILISPRAIDPEKEERKNAIAIWKEAELEAQRMDGLRLP